LLSVHFRMRHLPRRPALLSAALLASLPAMAAAQVAPSIDARTWRPSMSPSAGLVLEPTQTPGPWQWNVAAWLAYAQSPVTLRSASSGDAVARPVAHAATVDLVAGIGLGDRAAIGLDVPVLVWQDSCGASCGGGAALDPSIVSGGRVPMSGIGD